MHIKHNPEYEDKIIRLAQDKIKAGKFKVFDYRARVVTRASFPELVEQERTEGDSCLILVNGEGEVIVFTQEAENMIRNVVNGKDWRQPFSRNR